MFERKIRGIDLAYVDRGEGESLLFVHGHPFNNTMWQPQIEAFAPTHRVIAPDLCGYGQSGLRQGAVLLDEMALDIAVLLDALGIEQVTLCGLSMGGQIVLDFARLFPQRVKRLVICASSAKAETADSYQQRMAMADDYVTNGMEAYCQRALANFFSPHTIENQPQVVEDVRQMILNTPALGAASANWGRAERRDHTSILPTLMMPALVVVGEDDFFTPVSEATYIAERVPKSALHVLPKVGHMPNLESAKTFNSILATFLNGM